MVAAVSQSGIFFVEGLMFRCHPVIEQFMNVLKSGILGALRSIDAVHSVDVSRLANPAGQGVIYNLGCYPVSLTHLIVDTLCGAGTFATRQLAGFGNVSPENGNIVEAVLAIHFANGVFSTIMISETHGRAASLMVTGTRRH